MKIKKESILVGINPYNGKKRKFKYLGRNDSIGAETHPMKLYDYKEKAIVYISKAYIKQWQIKPYVKKKK